MKIFHLCAKSSFAAEAPVNQFLISLKENVVARRESRKSPLLPNSFMRELHSLAIQSSQFILREKTAWKIFFFPPARRKLYLICFLLTRNPLKAPRAALMEKGGTLKARANNLRCLLYLSFRFWGRYFDYRFYAKIRHSFPCKSSRAFPGKIGLE